MVPRRPNRANRQRMSLPPTGSRGVARSVASRDQLSDPDTDPDRFPSLLMNGIDSLPVTLG